MYKSLFVHKQTANHFIILEGQIGSNVAGSFNFFAWVYLPFEETKISMAESGRASPLAWEP